MCDNLDDEKRNILKQRTTKKRKEKCDNLGDNEKEQMKKEDNKRKNGKV